MKRLEVGVGPCANLAVEDAERTHDLTPSGCQRDAQAGHRGIQPFSTSAQRDVVAGVPNHQRPTAPHDVFDEHLGAAGLIRLLLEADQSKLAPQAPTVAGDQSDQGRGRLKDPSRQARQTLETGDATATVGSSRLSDWVTAEFDHHSVAPEGRSRREFQPPRIRGPIVNLAPVGAIAIKSRRTNATGFDHGTFTMSHTTNPASILVADDDPEFLRIIEHHIRSWGWRVESVLDKTALLRRLASGPPGLLLMDVRFGEHDGLEVLQQIQKRHADLKVVLLTAFGSIENAVAAVRLGAVDYLTKPVDLARLRSVVEHIYDEPTTASARAGGRPPCNGRARPILGESRAIRELRELTQRAAASDCTVLVLGESGTGKELVARALHEMGPRRAGPFVPFNVAALPRELVESTLFGHAKGAFTGADRMQCGCCEAADGGTLFLDEIGEMEIGLQAKLLRFLQERTFQRVGQSELVRVDARIVAATNRDPIEQVRLGLLREDLYYRLNVLPIVAPPLRNRREDVPILARCFIERFAARAGRPGAALSKGRSVALAEHAWPGNVRELENFVERLAVLYPGPIIDEDAVRAELGKSFAVASRPADPEPGELRPIDQVEYQAIAEALASAGGNVKEAAQRLGLGQATVYRKIKKYGISV